MSTNIISIFKVPGRRSASTLLSTLRKGGKEYDFETNSIGSFKRQLVRFKCTEYMGFKNSWSGPLHLLGLLNVTPQVRLDIDRFFVSIFAFTPRQVKALYQHFRSKKIPRKLTAGDRHFLTCMKETVSDWSSIRFPCVVECVLNP